MKRVIRENVFESNSSSCHAICVSKNRVDMDKIDSKMVYFEHGDFGWENDEYFGTWSKASYLYQAIWETSWVNYDWKDEEDKKRAKKERLALVKEKCDQIEEILDKYNIICEFDHDDYDDSGWENGYIDHGNELKEWVEKCLNDEEYLLTYLFGDSMIITGNDNDDGYRDSMYGYDDEDDEYYNTMRPRFDNYDVYEKWN